MLDYTNKTHVFVHQRKELAELIGFETRNKYEILDEDNKPLGFIAEQNKSILGFLSRYFLGHWRSFELHIFNNHRQKVGQAVHPFRWFFQRLEIYDSSDQKIGALQQRFSIFSKKFDLESATGKVILHVSSPFWRIWTFKFKDFQGKEKATIEKKWSGFLKEAFTDTDNFKVSFNDPNLDNQVRNSLVAVSVLIDLQYFEKHAKN